MCGFGEQQADNRRYARFLAHLNVGTPRTVRLIYFLPADRSPRQGIEEKMDALIKDVREFYAHQMENHGSGRRTFNIETDHCGKAVVHRVNGQFTDTYYYNDDTFRRVWREIHNQFDTTQNIYLAVVDVGNEQIGDAAGIATTVEDWGGLAAIPAFGQFFNHPLAAHELGHTFGLDHDFRSTDYIMSYGPWAWERTTRLSECAAKWLEIQRYFNPDIQLREWNFPTIELISPRKYTVGSASVPIQLRVGDAEDLHQVLLFGSGGLQACREFEGEKNTLVEFDYDGDFNQWGFSSLTDRPVHPISAWVVDTDGNVSYTPFNLFTETLQSLTKISGDDQPPGLPNTPLPVPLVVELRNVNDGFPYEGVWVSFAVTAGGGRLSETGALTDDYGRAATVFTLGPHRGSNTVEVSALGYSATFNAVAGSPVNLPDPLLRAVIEKTLNKVSGEPISQAEMATLTYTEPKSWSVGISDLTGLEFAINLTHLDLSDNSISDISSLANLTKLTHLSLRGDSVSDISPLAGLTNLEWLVLNNNTISDISDVGGLISLTVLALGNNAISDISPLAELTNLMWVYLEDNNIKDISPLTGLMHLQAVQLTGNSVSDLSPLAENQALGGGTQVDVRKNLLSYTSIQAYIPSLREKGVEVDFDNRNPMSLEAISGGEQEGFPGEALTNPFVVEVKDESGLVFEGVPVTFAVTAGGGTLTKQNITTDSSGRAESRLTLGSNPGTNTVRATAEAIAQPEIFTAEGIRVPRERSRISGYDQEGFPGETLPNPIVVEVRDQFDKPLEHVTVTFTVSVGVGTLTVTSSMTDTNGRAESELTLGSNAGTNSVSASASGIEKSAVFTSEGIRTPQSILKISGDSQEGIPNTKLPDPFIIEVQDKNGSSLEGVPVTFAVTNGGGTLSVTSMETAPDGRAESILTFAASPKMHTVEVSAKGVETTVIFSAVAKTREFALSLTSGSNLIHIPLRVTTVDGLAVTVVSVGDLYDALGGADTVNLLTTRDFRTQQWHSYLGHSSRGTLADPLLTDDRGIIASMKMPVELHLAGDALGKNRASTIRLQPGTNLVGVPLRDSLITRVSGLLALEGIRDNVPAITVLVNGNFKVVAQAGDDGDIPITGGQSFIMAAQSEAAVVVTGDGWGGFSGTEAAPPLAPTSINVRYATPVLCLTGSIVYEAGSREWGLPLAGASLSVIVKNLITGKTVTTLATKGDSSRSKGVGYQLTLVETASGRTARAGDILEIFVQSFDSLIRVEPLRYMVTPTDVKNNRIELSELIVYAIPTQTRLLLNYPNPFNPETWIPYQLAKDANVTLTIYDARGALVRRLEIGHQSAGYYTSRGKAAYWNGRNEIGELVASGLYFYQLGTPSFRQLRRMVNVK